MLQDLLVGLPVTVFCLALQGYFVGKGLRFYARYRRFRERRHSYWLDVAAMSIIMLLMLATNFVQMIIWAVLFLLIGEFNDFASALYHSGVNFSTLGYGDIVMSERWRLLGPLEASQGILMFGVSTAIMTAAVGDVMKLNVERRAKDKPP